MECMNELFLWFGMVTVIIDLSDYLSLKIVATNNVHIKPVLK